MKYIRRFAEIGIHDVGLVGGKNASLGEMYRELAPAGVKVPNGFATTAQAYRDYLEHNALTARITDTLKPLDTTDLAALARAGKQIREWVTHGAIPPQLEHEIAEAYRELARQYGADTDVAVRSSATAEDLPTASFAGQQETYLNISGTQNLLATCKRVFASLFTDRAISYRVHQGFGHLEVALSIGVQKMVRADLGASGVMFSIDTETGFRDAVFITAAYGLGENIVQGAVNPDEYYVFKPTLEQDYRPILKRQRGEKAIKMVYTPDGTPGMSTRNISVSREERERFALTDNEVLRLARYAVAIEKHYSAKTGHPMPMDIEWAKDGISGEMFILQARPETVHAQADPSVHEIYKLKTRGNVLVTGKSVGQKIATGKVRVILEARDMRELHPGEILVTDITDPDWEPVMKIAGGIVTNRGGRTCHAAIVARELGIPALVGTSNATQVLATGQVVTLSCAEGDAGVVYEGEQKFDVERVDLRQLPTPNTHLMLNLGNPERAFELSRLPVAGVGLARLEFIINHSIQIHPRALLEYDTVDQATREKIDSIVAGYTDRRAFYVQRLAEGIATIAAAFYPRPVIVRTSDFKSNEYASLIGGEAFEPKEENPMLGLRGAARYFSPKFAPCFALECAALKYVRESMGLLNVAVMIPFVRTVDEGLNVLELMQQHGLKRGMYGLNVFLMCEIPSNALLAEKFLEHFDGFSIGSNDLTQLTLGADRDSGLLKGFDERNEAVLKLIEMAIIACNHAGKYIGICGQAPSDFPEITRWLVERGIGSISLNPDSVLPMTNVVLDAERHRGTSSS